mgnify:CR=1 FL=1
MCGSPPPTVALTLPVCADENVTTNVLVDCADMFVGIITLPDESNTTIAGYLSPKLCVTVQVVEADDCV